MTINRKPKGGLTYVANEKVDDVLGNCAERHPWPRNDLVPRERLKLKLKLTKRQHKILQTPSYLR